MTSGIDVKDLVVGTGALAERGKVAVVHFRGCLNRGEEVLNTYAQNQPAQIHLGKRDVIAGLEQGIEGMREGGRRELVISPHLAYGEKGVPGSIPPNAVLRCEVELLAVRVAGDVRPEDFPPGRHLVVMRAGEGQRNIAKWQFGITDAGRAGICITKPPRGGATWRHMRHQDVGIEVAVPDAQAMIQEAIEMPLKFPSEVLSPDDIGGDTTEKANSIPRESKSDIACLSVTVWERGGILCNYYLRENSAVLLNAAFYKTALRGLESHLGASVRF